MFGGTERAKCDGDGGGGSLALHVSGGVGRPPYLLLLQISWLQHPAATGYWCSKGHWFNDSWLGISVVSHLDFLLPVDSDMYGSVVSHWRSVLVYPDAH